MFRRILFYTGIVLLLFLGLLNWLAYQHAYRFLHFNTEGIPKPEEPQDLTWDEKLYLLWNGAEIPKPLLDAQSNDPFEIIELPATIPIEAWWIRTDLPQTRGTVILFHGYLGNKSRLLANAQVFREMGFHTLLVDFSGHGGSGGNRTTLGYFESQEVLLAYQWVLKRNPKANIFLFGSSMGAVAIMKAIHDHAIMPSGILLECPFGNLLTTVRNRFTPFSIPSFPLAELLVFYGGIQNGFWGFGHNPTEYARKVRVPTLLMYGLQDPKVTLAETQAIYQNITGIGKKHLVLFEDAGHENYFLKEGTKWRKTVGNFLVEYGK